MRQADILDSQYNYFVFAQAMLWTMPLGMPSYKWMLEALVVSAIKLC